MHYKTNQHTTRINNHTHNYNPQRKLYNRRKQTQIHITAYIRLHTIDRIIKQTQRHTKKILIKLLIITHKNNGLNTILTCTCWIGQLEFTTMHPMTWEKSHRLHSFNKVRNYFLGNTNALGMKSETIFWSHNKKTFLRSQKLNKKTSFIPDNTNNLKPKIIMLSTYKWHKSLFDFALAKNEI